MSNPLNGTVPALKCACGHFAPLGEITTCRFCDCERHAGTPYGDHDPQTPLGAETALQAFSEALERARVGLAQASDAEVEAELARDAARRKLMFTEECPRAGVFGGVRVTVAERDAWIDDRIVDEERAFRLAKAAREAAEKYLSVVGKQLSAQQTLSKSVGQGYGNSTGSGRW